MRSRFLLLPPWSVSRSRLALLMIVALAAMTAVRPQRAAAQVGGVYVDPRGMLRETATLDPMERLSRLREGAVPAPATNDIAAVSSLRKVSLRRLEAAVAGIHREGGAIPADIACMAGLTRLQAVLFFPEEGDVVLAGPAEGWTTSASGEVVGARSQRPVLRLEDWIVALRFAFDEQPASSFLGCSIEPTAEGVQRYAAFMRSLGGQMDRSRLPQIFLGMEQAMGDQEVKLYGAPKSSAFALKLIVADYRLKRIALGHDPAPVPDLVNYLDLQAKRLNPGAPQRQHRWWFVGEYDAVLYSGDRLAWEFEGSGVKVQTAPTWTGNAPPKTSGQGGKKPVKEPQPSPAASQFANTCTRLFPKVAERVPIFAELQNLVALAVAAELIAESQPENRADDDAAEASSDGPSVPASGYRPKHWLDREQCPVTVVATPSAVPSLSNYRLVENRHWLISVSGGVELNPRNAVRPAVRKEAPGRRLGEQRSRVKWPEDGRWWWD